MNDLDNRLITSAEVRRIFGGISDMSLWRWVNDPALGFPQPVYIQRRRFWNAQEIEAFRARMTEQSAQRGTTKAA
jgi:predicted DNA-binding transcriptional regulator AlpA